MSDNTQAFCANCDRQYFYFDGSLWSHSADEYMIPIAVCLKCDRPFKRDKHHNLVWASDWRMNRIAVEE